MARIVLPTGDAPERERMWSLTPEMGAAANAFSDAVQTYATLPLREMEAARMRIAHINGCIPCSEARIEDMEALGIDEDFYADVDDPARRGRYSEREALAIGFAERFAAGADTFDEDFWARMRAAFADQEIVELVTCIAKWFALGRINAVMDLSVACPIVIAHPVAHDMAA